MTDLKITKLTMDEFVDAYDFSVETDVRIEHAGMIATKCVRHPEHGLIVLVAGVQEGGLMIHPG